eukprot:1983836-Amphidinium_carterae.1
MGALKCQNAALAPRGHKGQDGFSPTDTDISQRGGALETARPRLDTLSPTSCGSSDLCEFYSSFCIKPNAKHLLAPQCEEKENGQRKEWHVPLTS